MLLLALYAIALPDALIAAPPFLPPGRGGLILITGGLSMLAFALFLLSVTQRPLPGGVTQAHAPTPGRGRTRASRAKPRSPASATKHQAASATKSRAASATKSRAAPAASASHTIAPTSRGAHKAVLATAMQATSAAPDSQLQWPEFVQRAAAAEGLGRPHVLSVQGTRATLLVEHCDSCRRRKGHCKRERRALQRAARRLSRQAEVREVSCNIDRRHACAFELRMRGRT